MWLTYEKALHRKVNSAIVYLTIHTFNYRSAADPNHVKDDVLFHVRSALRNGRIEQNLSFRISCVLRNYPDIVSYRSSETKATTVSLNLLIHQNTFEVWFLIILL